MKKFDLREIKENLSANPIGEHRVSNKDLPKYIDFLVGTFKDAETAMIDENNWAVVILLKPKCWIERSKLYPDHLDLFPLDIMPMAQLWVKGRTTWSLEEYNPDGWHIGDFQGWMKDSEGEKWIDFKDHLNTLLLKGDFNKIWDYFKTKTCL